MSTLTLPFVTGVFPFNIGTFRTNLIRSISFLPGGFAPVTETSLSLTSLVPFPFVSFKFATVTAPFERVSGAPTCCPPDAPSSPL